MSHILGDNYNVCVIKENGLLEITKYRLLRNQATAIGKLSFVPRSRRWSYQKLLENGIRRNDENTFLTVESNYNVQESSTATLLDERLIDDLEEYNKTHSDMTEDYLR